MPIRVLSMLDLSYFPGLLDPLRKLVEVHQLTADQAVLQEQISDFDGFLTPLTVQTNQLVLSRAGKLKFIATASTGTDHIAVSLAEKQGITILSLKEDFHFLRQITATAELTWALLLSVMRFIPDAVASARQGDWARDLFRGHQLSGKTLGVLGYGRLGSIVADYGKAFRMSVLACDTKPILVTEGVLPVDFDVLLASSDVLTIHIHLTDSNRRLFNSKVFSRMKSGSVLINTSRGAIIDEIALLEALESGRLAGAGLDVIDGEWRSDLDRHPLIVYSRDHPNLVITPHIGGVTYESQRMAYERIISKVIDFLVNQELGEEKPCFE
jgi:D-3-phosphoglycerate dehydrogenase / 2-oxoglutarate reductase